MIQSHLRHSTRLLLAATLALALAACGASTPTDNTPGDNPPGNPGPPTNPGNPTDPGTPSPPPPPVPPIVSSGEVQLENMDGSPYADRLVFSKIGAPVYEGDNIVQSKDTTTLRIKNAGKTTLQIKSLTFTNGWTLATPVATPANVEQGAYLDVPVKFIGDDKGGAGAQCVNYVEDTLGVPRTKCTYSGKLTIATSDPQEASKTVQLAGIWGPRPERNNEPTLKNIIDTFGFKTDIGEANLNDNYHGTVRQSSPDEVLSPYWKRADATKPVTARWLAAFHGRNDSDGTLQYNHLYWFPKGITDPNTATKVMTQDKVDMQTILPRAYSLNGPAYTTFTPATEPFGFRLQDEWSDPALNTNATFHSQTGACEGDAGHYVRFYKLKDRGGQVVPNSYIAVMDAYCVNYDYNDNVFLISNIAPETAQ